MVFFCNFRNKQPSKSIDSLYYWYLEMSRVLRASFFFIPFAHVKVVIGHSMTPAQPLRMPAPVVRRLQFTFIVLRNLGHTLFVLFYKCSQS